jgi:hypothetical protein
MATRWLGIDFSGNATKWRPGCATSNVWVAEVHGGPGRHSLQALARVQHFARDAVPFEGLCQALSKGEFAAAAIDAPFSVPARFVRPGGHAELVARIGRAAPPDGRPFLQGADFVRAVTGQAPPLSPPKPYRATEQYWWERKVNTRSTLWAGRRGGAQMAAACVRLLHLADRPAWPWVQTGGGLLVEGFPAAQLCQWGLPHQRYNGVKAAAEDTRCCIATALGTRLDIASDLAQRMLASADALDAVICAFAAIAVTSGHVACSPGPEARVEGWIAVHE